jgi:hypothetical protein
MEALAFFPRETGDPDFPVDPDNEFNLTPVTRDVDNEEPARSIINELLLNPTDTELLDGFFPLDTAGLSIQMITIKDGIARLTLTGRSPSDWASEITRLILGDAVRRTLLQFDTIESVVTSTTI